MQVKTKGIVLHEMAIGDNDKRLIILTKDLGKITVFSKGARKMNSRLMAVSQKFSYSELELFQGKTSYNINSGTLIESFHHIRKDIEQLTYGLFILEFVEYITHENEPNHELMQMVLKTLKVLEQGELLPELVSLIFQLKACTYIGYTPWVESCIKCDQHDAQMYFSPKEGGTLCGKDSIVDKGAIRLQEGVLYTLQYIISCDLKELYQFTLDEQVFITFKLVIERFIEYNLNKSFKTLDFLDLNKMNIINPKT
ncbi:MAG: DNA repair protein RecO [Vallitaleaceae bacterium]|jgi:DNA repair protein RecO (recombination protein O)|nr:DNA repair protein RecO [Vallitaleaceae bacterium]